METGRPSNRVRFAGFEFDRDRRCLMACREGERIPVPLGARAFDMLAMLIEHRARTVSKDEILTAIWHGQIVEENNLAVQISAIRRALGQRPDGERFIVTVPGQGYRFVAPVEPVEPEPDRVAQAEPVPEPIDSVPAAAPPPAPEPAPPVLPPALGPVPALPAPSRSIEADPPAPASRRRISPPRSARLLGLMALAVSLLAVAVAVRLGLTLGPGPPAAPRLSIAVLPFRNLALDRSRDYVADAVTDDLTTDLSHIPDGVVIARESVDAARDRDGSPQTIGRALHVRYLLRGSLREEGASIHADAQLLDAASARTLWAAAFDVARDPLGDALGGIVRRVGGALRFNLVEIEGRRSMVERPSDPDALDLVLRARSILDRDISLAGLTEAQALLERASDASPGDGPILGELGQVLTRKLGDFDDPDDERDHARAVEVVSRALSLAPGDPFALVADGMLASIDGHCRRGEQSFQEALAVDPNGVAALMGLARCERELGQMRAMIATLHEVLQIDPLGAGSERILHLIGMGHLMLGDPHEALAWFRRAGAAEGGDDRLVTPLSWRDWRRIYVIASTGLDGDPAGAASLYRSYDASFPHRTVRQLASYASPAMSALPGHRAVLAALERAGMPRAIDEDRDFGIAPHPVLQPSGDFDPTPLAVPCARRIDTATMRTLMGSHPPVVIDIGTGEAVPPGAIWLTDGSRVLPTVRALPGDAPGRPIVTMGVGPFGGRSYDAALSLCTHGYRNVLWYRGGEQAWIEAGGPVQDRRNND